MSAISTPTSQQLLTHSRMTCAKTCLRKHFYRYELGVRRDRDAQPLRMGSAFHLGLDLRAKGVTSGPAIEQATAGYRDIPAWVATAEQLDEWNIEKEIVGCLLAGYYWLYSGENIEVLASEIAFDIPIRNPETGATTPLFRFAGKIDKIVRLRDGRTAIMEHKTCGDDLSPESDYWKRLRIDQQISGYYLAARALGYDVQTVLYDVARKPSISPRQIPVVDNDGFKIVRDLDGARVYNKNGKPRESASAENGWTLCTQRETAREFNIRLMQDISDRPDFYFARQEIPRLQADLEEFEAELWQQQQLIRECQKSGRWFRNTSACRMMGACEYFDVCTNGIDLAETMPEGWVRVTDLHPELAE